MSNIFIGDEPVSNKFLKVNVEKCAEEMKKLGISEGEPIFCISDTQLGTIVQWKSCNMVGAVPVLVSNDFPVENSKAVKICGARYEFTYKRNKPIFKCIFNTAQEGEIKLFEKGAFIQMTSASTGEPKFVLRTKYNLEHELKRYVERLEICSNDVLLSMAPFYHSFGLCCTMLAGEYAGADIIIPDVLIPRRIAELSEKMKITYLFGVPYFFDKMTQIPERYKLYANTKNIISSGGELSKEIFDRFTQNVLFCGFDKEYKLDEIKEYIVKIKEELSFYAQYNFKITAVHLGGGTPTLIPPEFLEDVLNHIKKNFTLADALDINIEGSATTIYHPEIIEFIKKNNITRVSVGVQTFNREMRAVFDTT